MTPGDGFDRRADSYLLPCSIRMTGWNVITIVPLWLSWLSGRGAAGDRELMEQLAAGDSQALGILYDRHAGRVMALLVRMLRERAAAEDLLQEVFWSLWRHAGSYNANAESALPWLLVMARNRALDQLRGARRRHETGLEENGPAADIAAVEPGIEEKLWTGQRLELLRRQIALLAPQERQVLELAYFDGMTQSEISAKLGQPLGTVKTWSRTGLQKLRKAVL